MAAYLTINFEADDVPVEDWKDGLPTEREITEEFAKTDPVIRAHGEMLKKRAIEFLPDASVTGDAFAVALLDLYDGEHSVELFYKLDWVGREQEARTAINAWVDDVAKRIESGTCSDADYSRYTKSVGLLG